MSKTGLIFIVDVEVDPNDVDGLGEDMATFLKESWFNGEDVFDVSYVGRKIYR